MADDVLTTLARRYCWWQEPEVTLARRGHFICQMMELGTAEDVRTARRILGDDALRDAPPVLSDGINPN